MQFQPGSQVTYIELSENDVNRRFLVPNYAQLQEKILAVTSSQPKVNLVRTGNATVIGAPSFDIDTVAGLQAIPSSVTALYTIQVYDHDVLGNTQTTARYSEDLSSIIGNAQVTFAQAPVQQVPATPASFPSEPKVDLTQQLRAQMLGQKQAEFAAPAPVAQPPAVVSSPNDPPEGQMKLEDFLAQEKAKKAQSAVSKAQINERLKPQPVGKIDILARDMTELREEVKELREEVSGLYELLSEIRNGLGV